MNYKIYFLKNRFPLPFIMYEILYLIKTKISNLFHSRQSGQEREWNWDWERERGKKPKIQVDNEREVVNITNSVNNKDRNERDERDDKGKDGNDNENGNNGNGNNRIGNFVTGIRDWYNRIIFFTKNSLLGSIIKLSCLEIIGSYFGGILGGFLFSKISPYILRSTIIPLIFLLFYHSTNSVISILFSISFLILIPGQFYSFIDVYSISTGYFLGQIFGEIICGYLGLKYGGSNVILLPYINGIGGPGMDVITNRDNSQLWNCYGISMIRYYLMGIIYNGIFTNLPSIFNIPRQLIRILLQNCAYNSHLVIPFIKRALERRKITRSSVFAFVEEFIESKYRISYSLSSNLHNRVKIAISPFPQIIKRIIYTMTKLDLSVYRSNIKDSILISFYRYINFLKKNGVYIPTKKFSEYICPTKNSIENLIYKNANVGERILFPIMSKICNSIDIDSILLSTLEQINSIETRVIGISLLRKEDIEGMRIYIYGYLLYFCCNISSMEGELTLAEEYDIILSINELLILSYIKSTCPIWIYRVIDRVNKNIVGVIDDTIETINKLSPLFRQPEQESILLSLPVIIDAHFKIPDYGYGKNYKANEERFKQQGKWSDNFSKIKINIPPKPNISSFCIQDSKSTVSFSQFPDSITYNTTAEKTISVKEERERENCRDKYKENDKGREKYKIRNKVVEKEKNKDLFSVSINENYFHSDL